LYPADKEGPTFFSNMAIMKGYMKREEKKNEKGWAGVTG
jgi:hypothetical protein